MGLLPMQSYAFRLTYTPVKTRYLAPCFHGIEKGTRRLGNNAVTLCHEQDLQRFRS